MNTSIEERKEIAGLVLRQILNSFPIAGPILTDILFTYRNNVRQNRINHFVGLLEDEFTRLDINLEAFKSEESLDLFEGIFKKVADSRSEAKRIAFKNLLLTGIKKTDEIQNCEVFSEILLKLTEIEFQIISKHQQFLVNGKGILTEKHRLQEEMYEIEQLDKSRPSHSLSQQVVIPSNKDHLQEEIDVLKQMLEQYEAQCTASSFGLTEGEYRYALQNLFALGLLADDGIGAIAVRPFEIMSLTEFALDFLRFVQVSD